MDIKTQSEANVREHWAVKARRAKSQRNMAFALSRMQFNADGQPEFPAVVTITRLASRKLDDDNLARSMKAVRDGIADALRIDDGSDLVQWRYEQDKAKRSETAVLVEITTGPRCRMMVLDSKAGQ